MFCPLNSQPIKKLERNLFPELPSLDYGLLHPVITSGQGYDFTLDVTPYLHSIEFHLPVFMYNGNYRN